MDSEQIYNLNFDSDYKSSIILSIILGITVGILIGNYFFKQIIYHGPDSNEIIKQEHEDSNGKFKWETYIVGCPIGTFHE